MTQVLKQKFNRVLMIALDEVVGTDEEKALKLLEVASRCGDRERIMKELIQKCEEARYDKQWQEAKNYLSLAHKVEAEGADKELKHFFGASGRILLQKCKK